MQMTVGDNEDREGVRHVAEQRGFVGGGSDAEASDVGQMVLGLKQPKEELFTGRQRCRQLTRVSLIIARCDVGRSWPSLTVGTQLQEPPCSIARPSGLYPGYQRYYRTPRNPPCFARCNP